MMGSKKIRRGSLALRASLVFIFSLFAIFLLAACGDGTNSSEFGGPENGSFPEMPMGGPPQNDGGRPMDDTASRAEDGEEWIDGLEAASGEADPRNGERIYFTATNEEGGQITYRDGPDFGGMMMGRYLTCAACHGPEAQGGEHVMHMQVMDAPAITYDALRGEGEEHAEDEDNHGDEHESYDLEAFRLAVVEGRHSDGEPLDDNMPRWNIAEDDLRDLFAFLKGLSSDLED